jgi:hypothetical protein
MRERKKRTYEGTQNEKEKERSKTVRTLLGVIASSTTM